MGAISFTGLASGMDTDSWIQALVQIKSKSLNNISTKKTEIQKSQNTLSTIKTKFSGMLSSIEKFTDSKYGNSFDIFGKNTVSSSNESTVAATVSSEAARQSLNVVVKKLASSTKAVSTLGQRGLINNDTTFNTLSSGNAKDGSFNIYVDGKKYTISTKKDPTLDDEDNPQLAKTNSATLGTIIDRINEIEGVNAEIVDGVFKISGTDPDGDGNVSNVVVGSVTDSSNFASVMGLVRDESTQSYSSFTPVSAINLNSTIVEMFGEDAKGTLTIGEKEFTIDENTTFQKFISDINNQTNSGVNAYWDAAKSELVLTSKTEGAFNINIEGGTSSLTDVLGYTTSSLSDSGEKVSKIVQSTQSLGDYADLTINGTSIISSSNTVTSDISGIEGLTLTLKAVSKENDDGVIEPVKIDVSQDTNALKDALKSFISAFNETIEKIDNSTSYGEALFGETSLTNIRNNLRRTVTSSAGVLDENSLKLLAEIGITTGKASASTDTKNVNKLQLDEDKFADAIAKNPEAVKKLLIGDNKGNANSGGIMNKLETIAEQALDTSSGYFGMKSTSYEKSVKNYESSYTREKAKVEAYEARLKKQFNYMEQMISSIQSSYSRLGV